MAMCVCQWGRRWPDIFHSIVSLCWVLYVEAFRSIQMSIDADFLWSSSVVRWFVAVEHWVISAGYSWNPDQSSVAETHQRDGLGPLPSVEIVTTLGFRSPWLTSFWLALLLECVTCIPPRVAFCRWIASSFHLDIDIIVDIDVIGTSYCSCYC